MLALLFVWAEKSLNDGISGAENTKVLLKGFALLITGLIT